MNNGEEIEEYELNTFLYIFFLRTHQRTENERCKRKIQFWVCYTFFKETISLSPCNL